MEKVKNIVVVGDPIRDIYCQTEGNITVKYEEKLGGALNVYANIASILEKTKYIYPNQGIHFLPRTAFLDVPDYTVLRLNSNPDIHLCGHSNRSSYYNLQAVLERQMASLSELSSDESIIVFSDYNKGILNRPLLKANPFQLFKLAVVDSKYRSLNAEYLNPAIHKIWRCTGGEYDAEYAKKFDYTIWTNGPLPISLFNKKQELIKTFIIKTKSIEPVDTCGAGDTFTAAIAAFFYELDVNEKNLIEAITFASRCSENVIMKEKTSTTDIKL